MSFDDPDDFLSDLEADQRQRDKASGIIRATPFAWREPSAIPKREWLYGRHLVRKYVSITVAAGGTGKSLKSISEALSMASGYKLLHDSINQPLTVWLFNLEDDADEMDRRIIGCMTHFDLQASDIAGRFYRDSGRNQPLVLAKQTDGRTMICEPVYAALRAEILERGVDVLVVDPFVSSHQVPESDNGAIDLVAKTWGRLADECGCAIELIHHVRKSGVTESSADSARGASALVNAARSVDALNPMTSDQAEGFGIHPDEVWRFFRAVDAKSNLAPRGGQRWFKLESVALGNGTGPLDEGDSVGVCTSWTPPGLMDDITGEDAARAIAALVEGEHRESMKSPQWAGNAIGAALGLDPSDSSARKTIAGMLAVWIKSGALRVIERPDRTRVMRKFITPAPVKSFD
jgi:hypothetical protein